MALASEKIFKHYLDKFQAFANKGAINKIQHNLSWEETDTYFLELITALYENKSINNDTNDLSRKDAIKIISQIFNLEIKDTESKLVRATERKKNRTPFLTKLQQTFEEYCQRKEDKRDELRK